MCPVALGISLTTMLQIAAAAGAVATTGVAAGQARSVRKATERQNIQIAASQKEMIRSAEQATQTTTGSGEDPARTLISEIKKAKVAEKLADEVGIATTPFNIGQSDKKSGTGLNL